MLQRSLQRLALGSLPTEICQILTLRIGIGIRYNTPTTHAQMATFSGGTTCFVTKYMPPAVGYADTSSLTWLRQQMLCQAIQGV